MRDIITADGMCVYDDQWRVDMSTLAGLSQREPRLTLPAWERRRKSLAVVRVTSERRLSGELMDTDCSVRAPLIILNNHYD